MTLTKNFTAYDYLFNVSSKVKCGSFFPQLFHRIASAVPAAFSAGAGPFFHPFPIQPHPLVALIMVGTKMSSLETCKSR